jgi:hypothetical protein
VSGPELVIEVASKLPANTSLKDIMREIAVVAGVNEALEASDRNDVVSVE